MYIQIYKEVTVAIFLGSEYAKDEFRHPNIVVGVVCLWIGAATLWCVCGYTNIVVCVVDRYRHYNS